jgi:hypothetical protein
MNHDNREKETNMVKIYEHMPESKVREAWRRYNINNDPESNLEVERDIDAFMSRTGERDRSKAYHLRERELRHSDEPYTAPQVSPADTKAAGDKLNAVAKDIMLSGRVAFAQGNVHVGRVSYKEGLDLAALANPRLGETYLGRPIREDGFEFAKHIYSDRSK